MKLWISGEVQSDVAEAYRSVRKQVETNVNGRLEPASSSWEINKWAFIGIIRSEDSPDYCELSRCDKRRGVMEFRLRLDHSEFHSGDRKMQLELLYTALKRCVPQMMALGLSNDQVVAVENILDFCRTSE